MKSEVDRILDLYVKRGCSLREVASSVGRDHHYVKRRLERAGVIIVLGRYRKTLTAKPKTSRVKTCQVCSGEFKPRMKSHRFCSHACRGKAISIGLVIRTDSHEHARECPGCGESFRCRVKSRQKYCNRKCFEASHRVRMKGVNNPAFINGSSYIKKCYRGEDWDEVRKSVYRRDKFRCQKCGIKCVGRRNMTKANAHRLIQCHHIKKYRIVLSNQIDNLITVCVTCHGREEWGTRN